MFKKIFFIPSELKTHSLERNSYKFFYSISILFTMVIGYFTYYNMFVSKLYSVAIAESLSFLVLIAIFIHLHKKQNILQSSIYFIIVLISLLLIYNYFSHKENHPFIWSIFIPITSFYLLGTKKGVIMILIFLSLFLPYIYSLYPEQLNAEAVINITLGFIVMSITLFAYENSRENLFYSSINF